MKIDNQIADILLIVFKFLVIQIGVFWFCLLLPSKEIYHQIQDSSSKVQTYQSPNQVKLVKGEYKQAYLLKLNDQISGNTVLSVDCTPVIIDPLIAKFCKVFYNQTVRVLSVDLYEKYDQSNKRILSKIKSITYKDLDNRFYKLDLWVVPYSSIRDSYNAKKKFIFYTLLDFLFLMGFMWVIAVQKYGLEEFYKKKKPNQAEIFQFNKSLKFFSYT